MVAESPTAEKPVPLYKAGKLFDSNPSIQTLIRWKSSGILGPDRKTRVVLRSKVIGGRCFIEPSAAREFIAALNARAAAEASAGSAGNESKALEAAGC